MTRYSVIGLDYVIDNISLFVYDKKKELYFKIYITSDKYSEKIKITIVHHPFNLGYSYYLDNNCAYRGENDDEILSTSLKVSSILLDIKSRIALFNSI